jgi:hypothetical protein
MTICCFCYYGINVFSSIPNRQKLASNKSLGRLVFFLGLCLVIISAVDLSNISSTLTMSEQSIWPSSGKGIWIGLFVMAAGVFTLIAVREQSHSSFYILLPYILVSIILCFFGLLTSIAAVQRYTIDPYLSITENRNKEQGIELAINGLLVGIFTLSFLFLSCLSCMICWTIPNFCDKYRGQNPLPFYPPQQSSEFYPLQTPRLIHRAISAPFPRRQFLPPYTSRIRPFSV